VTVGQRLLRKSAAEAAADAGDQQEFIGCHVVFSELMKAACYSW
jgi:hypothetical protein